MTAFGMTHICLLMATLAFFAISSFAVSKMNRWGQNVMFFLAAALCAGGIFYRYGLGLSFDGGFTWKTLCQQMLQVCNFNFILVILMLIPGCELARQYSVFFSMLAASTTLFSISSSWASHNWYDATVLNSWLNHVFAIALPLWMMAAKRLKPEKKYVGWVTALVFVYFTVVYLVSEVLIANGVITPENSYSFIYDTGKIPVFVWLREIIPYPYFYLYPLAPVMFVFFWAWARLFKNYRTKKFSY